MKVFVALIVLVLLGVGALYLFGATAKPEVQERTIEVTDAASG